MNKKWKQSQLFKLHQRAHDCNIFFTVNKQPITLLSVYMPHSGYADDHVEKTYNMIQNILKTDKGVQIIGGDFNAELGPGVGVEQTCVGQYTFKEANNRGEWMKQ